MKTYRDRLEDLAQGGYTYLEKDDCAAIRGLLVALDQALKERDGLRAEVNAVETLAKYLHTAKADAVYYGPRRCKLVALGWHDAAGRVLNVLANLRAAKPIETAALAASAPASAGDGWRETIGSQMPPYDERVWVAHWSGEEWRVDVGWREGAEWWLKSGTWAETDGTFWMPIPPLPPAPRDENREKGPDAS